MTNALAVALGLALSSGVVYAQAAPPTPPTSSTVGDPRPSASPKGGAVPSKRPARPRRPARKPADPVPAAPAAPVPVTTPAGRTDPVQPRDKPGTDEKAGVN